MAAPASAATGTPQLTSPALIEPPLVDQHLPSLVLQIAVAPDPLMVGDTATITLTIFNQAPDPADDLVVTLPVPDGAQALPGAATLAPDKGWRWAIGHLDAQSSTTVTGQVQLDRMPAGRALLLIAEVTARGLPLPVSTSGGALVADPADGLREAAFTPGRATRLTAVAGQVEVQFSGRATPSRFGFGIRRLVSGAQPARRRASRYVPKLLRTSAAWGFFHLMRLIIAARQSTSLPSRSRSSCTTHLSNCGFVVSVRLI